MSPHTTRLVLRNSLVAPLVVVAAAPAGAALTHRYSFNDGTANDSVGNAHGVPVRRSPADRSPLPSAATRPTR